MRDHTQIAGLLVEVSEQEHGRFPLRACASRDGCRCAVAGRWGTFGQERGGGAAEARVAYLLPAAQLGSRALRQQPRQGLNANHLTDGDGQPSGGVSASAHGHSLGRDPQASTR